jgi:hypothetical protein
MPVEAQRFSFTEIDKSLGAASSLPYLPFALDPSGYISVCVRIVGHRSNCQRVAL